MPSVRRRRPYHRQRQRSMEFLWPFLLIILGSIILILLIQFVLSWMDQRETDLKNKIHLYLDQGSAQILPWGQTEWTRAYDGQLVLEGDVLSLNGNSRGVLQFYSDSLMRMDADTRLEVHEIVTDDEDEIHLELDNGRAWFNMTSEDALIYPKFVVNTDNMRVTSYGTLFEVSMTDRETVRVLEGEVLVEVFEQDSDREVVLEQVKVGVGQQVDLTASDVETIMSRQPVTLLEALDDEWKTTSWYSWNMEEDANPTVYEPAESEEGVPSGDASDETVDDSADGSEEAGEDESEVSEEEESVSERPVLTLTFPKESPYELGSGANYVSITGTATASTYRVAVISYDVYGNQYEYELQNYVPGSGTWRYNAAYEYGNLHEGRNLFKIFAEDESLLLESEPIEVIVEVPEGAFDSFEAAEEESEESSGDEEDESTEDAN